MKKFLSITLMFLFSVTNVYSYSGKKAEAKGKIYIGISKSEFCSNTLNFPCADTQKKAQNKDNKYPNLYYYDGKNYEIITTDDSRFYLFKDVTVPAWPYKKINRTYGNGVLISMHNSMAEAKEYMRKEILGLNEKERKEKEIVEKQKEQEGIMFTIKDKREQCEAIGFNPETEKFADCVLRLVELDIKKQQQTQVTVAQNNGNDALVKQLQRQNDIQSSQALINLGQQLLQPKQFDSNIYLPQTQRCTVQGFGSFSSVTCR